MGCLGLFLGSYGAPFWCSGGAFGLIVRVLGLTLGCLGVHVGRSGGILGAVGGLFGLEGFGWPPMGPEATILGGFSMDLGWILGVEITLESMYLFE